MDAPSCQGCRERNARIAELEARFAEVEARLQEQARLIVDLAKKLGSMMYFPIYRRENLAETICKIEG